MSQPLLLIVAVCSCLSGLIPQSAAHDQPQVSVVRLPTGGVQPHCITDAHGKSHVVYFKGEPSAGNLWYTTLVQGLPEFSKPIRVNSQEMSAVAVGTIRGPRLALGRNGRVHIVWNGSAKAEPKGPKAPSGAASAPMLYSRLNEAGTVFDPQRCVATSSTALDGGGSVAADSEGRVFVGWHAAQPSGPGTEADRQFWVATSTDDGGTFAPEVAVSPRGLGACACCGTAGFTDNSGRVHFLFRAAKENEHRDMQWMHSANHGATFSSEALQPWKANQCPMSSASISQANDGRVVLAWETQGQVAFTFADPQTGAVGKAISPDGMPKNRKHPSVAVDPTGRVLLAWAEGTGWNKGGDVCWQVFGSDGTPIEGQRSQREGPDGLKAWNAPAAVCAGGKLFVIY